MELTALALLAPDGNGPSHGIYNILGYRHPQTRPLCFLHAGVVLPAKGVKDYLLVLL